MLSLYLDNFWILKINKDCNLKDFEEINVI